MKNNMDQMKAIKKSKAYDPYNYRNDTGYIFYSPIDPPLERKIIESGGRVFEYNIELQQKKMSRDGSIGSDGPGNPDLATVLNSSIGELRV